MCRSPSPNRRSLGCGDMRKLLPLLAFCLMACVTPTRIVPRSAPTTTPAPTASPAAGRADDTAPVLPPPLPPPTESPRAALDQWSAWIVPTRAERTYGPVEWLGSVEAGLAVADELDRPLVLWIMSADPLSCDCPGELPGRRGNFGDPDVAPLLGEFVAAVDIVWRMQTSSDPGARLFRQGLEDAPRAGVYALSPSGLPLGSTHTLAVPDLMDGLGAALETWFSLEPEQHHLPPAAGIERWTTRRPDDGLILTAWGRDLPPAGDRAAPRPSAFRRDQVWIERGAARALVPTPLALGATTDASREIARPLAGDVLLDDVRGAVEPFTDGQIERATLFSRVVGLHDDVVELLLWGETRAVAPGVDGARGVETTLLGHATFEPARGTFIDFELLGRGRRWGRTESNARRGEEAASPIGFVLRPTTDEALRRAPPKGRAGSGREGD